MSPRACPNFRKYRFYVYDENGEPHHWPHCNVIGPGNDWQIQLPFLVVLAGEPAPPKAVIQYMEDHLDEIIAKWNELHPERQVTRDE